MKFLTRVILDFPLSPQSNSWIGMARKQRKLRINGPIGMYTYQAIMAQSFRTVPIHSLSYAQGFVGFMSFSHFQCQEIHVLGFPFFEYSGFFFVLFVTVSSYIGILTFFCLVLKHCGRFFFFVINHWITNYFSFLVTESVQLSRAVLLVNAECYTAWNTR